MFTTLKLPFLFDVERLKADLGKVLPEEWVLHHNRVDYDGGWSGAALRSMGGRTGNLILDAGQTAGYANTPLLERCDYFREVLTAFDCPLKGVRLLSLAPQSFIREHIDRELQYEDGEVRIHIPIQTNSHVEFYSNGERLLLEEGSTYYLNANLPHRVSNRGTTDRVHLVIDAKVNDWVDGLFRRSLTENFSVPRIEAEEEFAEFQKLVLREPLLEERLRAIPNMQDFLTTACEWGRERGLSFDMADVHAAKAGLEREELPRSVELETSTEPLREWGPVRVHLRGPEPVVEWAHFGTLQFTEPFFNQTLSAAKGVPFASVFRRYSSLEVAGETAENVAPSGFIFHLSRCGSTLISQLLAAVPGNLVMSEPPAVDDVVQANLKRPGLTTGEQVRWLRAIVQALGRRRNGRGEKYILKLDAWHTHQLPLFRAAFPETPWIFLYRDPLEVLAAQMAVPGLQSVPGMMDPRALALTAEDVNIIDRFGWCCKMLARICQSAIRFNDAKGRFLNYTTLPEAVWTTVAQHFNLQFSDADIAAMRERAQFNAKTPFYWTGKDESPKVLKDENQRKAAAELFDPIYRELDRCSKLVQA